MLPTKGRGRERKGKDQGRKWGKEIRRGEGDGREEKASQLHTAAAAALIGPRNN